ncbi:MAG: dTDP-glucose 4,6-dehydratase, partial [Desulfobacterales bacterium]|nr:dTDP-glucose 4,6-dehydratase [Desulfobacterales bacterium]
MTETMLVTGGCGFIGSCFVLQQIQQYPDLRLINLDLLTYAGNLENVREVAEDPRYTFVQADVADRPAVEAVFARYHPTKVVHFAAESHVDRSIDGPDVFVRTNVLGTQVLLDVARKQWQDDARMDTARFLYVSTDEVYGDLPLESTERFTEDSPLRPSSPYSVSKAAGDMMAQAYHRTYGMPTLITRSSNNYGPRQYPEKLIPLTIKRALAGEPIPVYGDGRNVRDWLYVEDNCRAIDAVLRRGTPGQVYNVGGGNELSNIDLVHLLLHVLAQQTGTPEADYTKLITFVPDRPGHDRRYALSSAKTQTATGWRPETSF